jgi:hypothetical protein
MLVTILVLLGVLLGCLAVGIVIAAVTSPKHRGGDILP